MATATATNPIAQYFKDFGVIRDNPIAFWGIQVVNLLDTVAYGAILAIVTIFLTDNIGWNDVHAGYIVTGFTSFVTISLLFSGFFTDVLGIRKSTMAAMGFQGLARLGCLVWGLWPDAPLRPYMVALFLFLMAPGVAMTLTVFQSANRRFSSKRSRSASFNLWYMIMNVGYIGAGLLIDFVRLTLKIDNSWIFGAGVGCAVVSSIAILFLVRRLQQVVGPGEEPEPEKKEEGGKKLSGFALFKSLVVQTAFWRFMVLMVSVLGVRAVFVYLYLLMPKYWVRVIGPDVEMGFLQIINPIVITVGVILMIPIAGKYNIFKMLVLGAAVSAGSLLILVAPWQWFGGDVAAGYFRMAVVFAVVLSFGELLWSPKLNEYTAAIAPKGQEGSYFGMSMMPWFFAKLTVSALSGHMLTRWCPEGIGDAIRAGTVTFWNSPEAMWLVLFFWAICGPVLALVLAKWLTQGADLDPAKRPSET